MKGDQQYIDALREMAKQSGAQIAVFAAPLALLITQMRFLLANEILLIEVLSTISLFAFSVGTVIAYQSRSMLEQLLSKELLLAGGNSSGKGFAYLSYIEGLWSAAKIDVSEQGLIAFAQKIEKPVVLCVCLGYGSLIVLVLVAIWSSPSV